MKITRIKERKMLFIDVSKKEALVIIKSLTSQMVAESPNVGREETYAEDGTYVSIAVTDL